MPSAFRHDSIPHYQRPACGDGGEGNFYSGLVPPAYRIFFENISQCIASQAGWANWAINKTPAIYQQNPRIDLVRAASKLNGIYGANQGGLGLDQG